MGRTACMDMVLELRMETSSLAVEGEVKPSASACSTAVQEKDKRVTDRRRRDFELERFGEKEATGFRTRRRQLCKEALVASCVVCKRFAMFAMTTLRMMLIGKCRSSRAVAKLLGIVV